MNMWYKRSFLVKSAESSTKNAKKQNTDADQNNIYKKIEISQI